MENNISVSLAKKLMKILPVNPTIENKPHDWEIFQHEKYTQANEQNKKSIRFSSSQARYEYEKNHCFCHIRIILLIILLVLMYLSMSKMLN